MVLENDGLAHWFADRLRKKFDERVLWRDVLQWVYLSMFDAAHGWDPEKGKYSTYCTWHVRRAINQLHTDHQTIYIPYSVWSGREASPRTQQLMKSALNCILVSFGQHDPDTDAAKAFGVIDPREETEWERKIREDTSHYVQLVQAILPKLPERQQKIIQMYVMEDLSLEQVAKKVKLSRERVRQLKELALQTLREKIEYYERFPNPVTMAREET